MQSQVVPYLGQDFLKISVFRYQAESLYSLTMLGLKTKISRWRAPLDDPKLPTPKLNILLSSAGMTDKYGNSDGRDYRFNSYTGKYDGYLNGRRCDPYQL